MANSEKLSDNIIALAKCDVHYTKKANVVFAFLAYSNSRVITQIKCL